MLFHFLGIGGIGDAYKLVAGAAVRETRSDELDSLGFIPVLVSLFCVFVHSLNPDFHSSRCAEIIAVMHIIIYTQKPTPPPPPMFATLPWLPMYGRAIITAA